MTVFDAKTGEKPNELRHTNGIDGLVWSNNGLAPVSGDEEVGNADGNYLISPHQNGLIKLWA